MIRTKLASTFLVGALALGSTGCVKRMILNSTIASTRIGAGAADTIGDYELALKPLRAITLMDNPSPVTRPMALLWEAKIEHARGNRAKAELWAKKALREDPAFADAQQFLDELGGAGA